jgi:hypothetical protein
MKIFERQSLSNQFMHRGGTVRTAVSQNPFRGCMRVWNSPPASAEVKKMWIYTSIPPYIFMA